jgi:hypothetical protein
MRPWWELHPRIGVLQTPALLLGDTANSLRYLKNKKNIFKFFILIIFNQKGFFDYFLFPEK